MKLYSSLEKNISTLKNLIISDDIKYFNFKVGEVDATIVYLETLSDKIIIGKQVVEPLSTLKGDFTFEDVIKNIILPETEKLSSFEKCAEKIISGDGVVFIENFEKSISVASKNPAARPVSEPPTSSVLKGPREGFVESIQTNINLIRQRLKSPDLTYKKFTIGKYSLTNVGLVYISSIANSKIVKTIEEKLKTINVDGIVDSSYVIKSISNKKTSMFKQVGTTEKPDVLVSKLLEGRVAIIVDGSPIVLTAPFVFIEDFQTSEDYYVNNYRANISRALRFLAVITAIFLPALFVSAQLFHLQLIPLNFLLTIVGSIKGIPLSPSVEMFFTLFIFEILNEASIRMPKYVGIAISVVGALVLGETAVNAGIVSTPTIMVVALSGICIYTVPDLTETLSVLRLIYLIVAGSFGGYGIILLTASLITYLTAFESFSVPYLSPYSPLLLHDLQDGITKNFFAEAKERPFILKTKNKTRRRS